MKASTFIIILSLLTLACSVQTQIPTQPVPASTATAANANIAAPTPPLANIIITREQVNIHGVDGVVEVAIQGDEFAGYCDGTWCYIGDGRRVWQGCTNMSDWADYRMCQ